MTVREASRPSRQMGVSASIPARPASQPSARPLLKLPPKAPTQALLPEGKSGERSGKIGAPPAEEGKVAQGRSRGRISIVGELAAMNKEYEELTQQWTALKAAPSHRKQVPVVVWML